MYDRTTANNPTDLDSILEAFEREDELSGGADVVDYLPDAADPGFERIAVELIRVDLERSWARGSRKRVEVYREIAPQLFTDPRRLAEIAFEEYRLRRQSGEPVNAAEYRHKYSIDTSVWPHEEQGDVDDDGPSSLLMTRANVHTTQRPNFPRVGDSFAGFDLVEQLGRGAFGVVFRATQADLAARDVVLKITVPRSVEPQRLARLQHTNIVPLYSMHEHDGLLAICMPFFGRRTLVDIIRRGTPALENAEISTVVDRDAQTLPANEDRIEEIVPARLEAGDRSSPVDVSDVAAIVELMAKLAEALAHAHDRGIVHSDLKPANVLLTDDGVPMLLDFNLASDSASSQKATLVVGGTLPYMAPEHLLATHNGGAVVVASDVYSLGVIAFELLTDKRPFRDYAGDFEHTVDKLVSDRKQTAPTVRSLNAQATAGLSSIVAHCLEFDLHQRYASAAQLAEDLRRHQQDLPLRHATDYSIPERSGKWLRRNGRGVRWAVAASLIGLLVSLSAMYVARKHRIQELEAATAFADFEADAQTAMLNMHAPGPEPELHAVGQSMAKKALSGLGFIGSDGKEAAIFMRLSTPQSEIARRQGIELLYDLASHSSNQREAKDAIQFNTTALELAPKDVSPKALLEQRVKLLASSGDDRGAAENAKRAQKATSDEKDNYLAATSLLESGRYANAVVAWERLCNENRRDPLRWLLLGNSYSGIGRFASAEACYTALIALQPNAMAGYLYRGLCRAEQGNFAAAESDYSEALLLNPSIATTRINRALAYLALRNLEAAERDTTAAIDGGLLDPRAYFVRALIRDAMRKHDLAKADRERGFAIEPIDDKGWVARGMSVLKVNPQRAAIEFQRGLEKYPRSKSLLQNLVHVHGDRLNRPETALKYADALVEMSPNDSGALASRAVVRARKGDFDAALRDGEFAAANHPSALTSLQLACVYSLISREKPAETAAAIRHLKKAFATDPKLAERAGADPDLAALQSNEEFRSILAAATKLTETDPHALPQRERSNEQNPKRASQEDSTKHSS